MTDPTTVDDDGVTPKMRLERSPFTTAETPTMRERLAWTAYSDTSGHLDFDAWWRLDEETKNIYRRNIEAILREMLEPSEGMLDAGHHAWMNRTNDDASEPIRDCWQAMIQHILNETQDR